MSAGAAAGRADVYRSIADAIAAAVEAGAARAEDWRMPWHRRGGGEDGAPVALPRNAATGAAYRGVNVVALWAEAEARGYPGGRWATYRQWAAKGAQVRRGEKAATVVFWRFPDPAKGDGGASGDDEATGGEEEGGRRGPWARAYHVFNAAQADGGEEEAAGDPPPLLPESERVASAEAFFSALPGLDVRHGGERAYYAPATDHVGMPPFAAFRDAPGYYATLAHEAAHWTGHRSRLARDLSGRFGSEAYAAEELVAEVGAAFAMAALGLATEPRPDHARYVACWLRLLRDDPRAIFAAASHAQRAADWMTAAASAEAPGSTPGRGAPT